MRDYEHHVHLVSPNLIAVAPYAWQYDVGQILVLDGIELPAAYEVHFSNTELHGTAKKQIGSESGCAIPDEFLQSGEPVFMWVYVPSEDHGETEYKIKMDVKRRAKATDVQPTPQEQSVIDETIAALNSAVDMADNAAEAASGHASDAALSATAAAESAAQAATSAEGVEHYAQEAAASAEEAAGYVVTVSEYASQAAASATAAASSAASADQSADEADTSADAAAISATNAAASATSASGSAATATQKASEAVASATAASGSASAASGSATQAAASATAASQSATSAAGSATAASNSATTASTKADEAAASAAEAAETAAGITADLMNKADVITDTASGSIVSIPDGMASPVLGLSVDIEPIQAGTGAPSPDNVRPISGRSEVNVYVEETYDAQATPKATIQLGQTVYGGAVDVTSGKLVIDKAIADLTTGMTGGSAGSGYVWYKQLQNALTVPNSQIADIISEAYKPIRYNAIASSVYYIALRDNGTIYVNTGSQSVLPVGNVVYALATPVEVTLTAEELDIFFGDNNIWADSGDTTVEYRADTKLWILKKIAQALNA